MSISVLIVHSLLQWNWLFVGIDLSAVFWKAISPLCLYDLSITNLLTDCPLHASAWFVCCCVSCWKRRHCARCSTTMLLCAMKLLNAWSSTLYDALRPTADICNISSSSRQLSSQKILTFASVRTWWWRRWDMRRTTHNHIQVYCGWLWSLSMAWWRNGYSIGLTVMRSYVWVPLRAKLHNHFRQVVYIWCFYQPVSWLLVPSAAGFMLIWPVWISLYRYHDCLYVDLNTSSVSDSCMYKRMMTQRHSVSLHMWTTEVPYWALIPFYHRHSWLHFKQCFIT